MPNPNYPGNIFSMEKKKKRVLIAVAHPDDEVLGCGATIAKHCENGDDVFVLVFSDGEGSKKSQNQNVDFRRESLVNALSILGVKAFDILNLPDNSFDTDPLLKIIQKVEPLVYKNSPELIYTHDSSDLNIDHRLVSQIIQTICRPLPDVTWREIRTFEVPSSTHWSDQSFVPNLFIDVSSTFHKKMKAMECYSTEMKEFPHARSLAAVEALAKWRGAMVGVEKAEAFKIIRSVI